MSLTKSPEISHDMRFRSLSSSVIKQNTNSRGSLNPRSHQISFSSHVITVLTNQNAINLQIFWENERFHQKYFHLNSSAVYNSSAKIEVCRMLARAVSDKEIGWFSTKSYIIKQLFSNLLIQWTSLTPKDQQQQNLKQNRNQNTSVAKRLN